MCQDQVFAMTIKYLGWWHVLVPMLGILDVHLPKEIAQSCLTVSKGFVVFWYSSLRIIHHISGQDSVAFISEFRSLFSILRVLVHIPVAFSLLALRL